MAVSYVGEFQTDHLSSLVVQTGNTVYSMKISELKEKPSIAMYIALAVLEEHHDIETGGLVGDDQITGIFVLRVVGKEVTCVTAKNALELQNKIPEDVTRTYYYDHDAI